MPGDRLPPEEDRVRVIYPSEARGVARARNLGIEEAAAEWVAFLDDDDLWAPTKLASQLAAVRESGAGWAFTSALAIHDDTRPVELFRAPSPDGLVRALFEYQLIPAGCSNVLARRELLRSLRGFDESFYQLADWDLWIRLAAADRAVGIDEILVAYVQHEGSMLLTHEDWVFTEYNRFRRKFRPMARELRSPLNDEGYAFWISNRLEDAGLRWRAMKASLYAGLRYHDPGLLVNVGRLLVRVPRRKGETEVAVPDAAPDWMHEIASGPV